MSLSSEGKGNRVAGFGGDSKRVSQKVNILGDRR